MGVEAALISGIAGIGAAGVNAAASQGATEYARSQNAYYNEIAAQKADARTRALYTDLYSPGAQLRQLKEAGLSPSLFYQDGTGISGQAGAQGAGPQGPVQNPFYLDPMTAAEVANMAADTRLKNSEADKNEGKNASGAALVSLHLAQAGLAGAQEALTDAQKFMQDIENMRATETYDASVRQIFSQADEAAWNARKAYFAADREGLLLKFEEDTYDARTAQEINKSNLLFWQAQVEEKQLEVQDATIKELEAITNELGERVNQRWKELQLQKTSIENQKNFWDNEVRVMFKQAQNKADEIYWNAVNQHHHETNRHDEEESRIDLEEYRAVLQALCVYGAIEARGGSATETTPTQTKTPKNKSDYKRGGHATDGKGVGTYKKGHSPDYDY